MILMKIVIYAISAAGFNFMGKFARILSHPIVLVSQYWMRISAVFKFKINTLRWEYRYCNDGCKYLKKDKEESWGLNKTTTPYKCMKYSKEIKRFGIHEAVRYEKCKYIRNKK
jgi:hypothetical protein